MFVSRYTNVKIMATVFLDDKGVLLIELMKREIIITAQKKIHNFRWKFFDHPPRLGLAPSDYFLF